MEVNNDTGSHEKDMPVTLGNTLDVEQNLLEAIALPEATVLEAAAKHINDLTKCKLSVSNDNNVKENKSGESELQKQVRLGEITPFQAAKESAKRDTTGTFNKTTQLLDLEKYLYQQAELAKKKCQSKKPTKSKFNATQTADEVIPNKKRRLERINSESRTSKKHVPRKREILGTKILDPSGDDGCVENGIDDKRYSDESVKNNELSVTLDISKDNTGSERITEADTGTFDGIASPNDSGSEYIPSDDHRDSEDENKKTSSRKKDASTKSKQTRIKRILDDGDEDTYRQRVESNGCLKNESFHAIDNLFKVPTSVWKRLYKYQRVSVQWLWELHGRNLGGLLGDEMGLGKTVQVIAFLAGLDCSELLSDGGRFRGLGPTLIICPATLLEQWVKHFHDWWPTLRVATLHQSGTYQGDPYYLVHSLKGGGVLVTSYSGVLGHKDLLVNTNWHYVILDEGHKIRNPHAKVSKAVKEFSTPHRLLLTGSPLQNSLKELWSLFDFILPGKLGTLPTFLEHFANPITRGGYTNASPLQEATALQVATLLKDAITPYMLRRTKTDVKHHVSLPEKNEQVLFCSLTDEQRKLYKSHLRSDDVSYVLHEKSRVGDTGRYRARLLVALTALRKICNHPDLYIYGNQTDSDDDEEITEQAIEKFGYWKRAGKMAVVRSLLKIWKKQGHRVLLFTQSRQMMHILEGLVQHEGYSYLRMDGTTPMSQRQQTITKFNENPSYFVFVLTTRVGGLGVNLTGANRVIIYDPDWNPATDAQARERAWRIGQSKRVTVYRLVTAGTIEEKMYHRQIFKLLLSNKVLEDPRQRRLFRTSDLAELFDLNEPGKGGSIESERLFQGSKLVPGKMNFSSAKVEEMRRLASSLSKKISKQVASTKNQLERSVGNGDQNDDEKTICAANASETEGGNREKLEVTQNQKCNITTQEETARTEIISVNDSNQNESMNETEISIEATKTEESLHEKRKTMNKHALLLSTAKTANENHSETPNDVSSCDKKYNSISQENDGRSKHRKMQKTKQKYSHRKKEQVSAIFEGERVPCLLGRRLGNSSMDELTATADDHYVLRKLFAKSKVSTAFQHETVLSTAGCKTDQKTPMQRLARQAAEESMEFVRQSRKWCWKPSWDKPPDE